MISILTGIMAVWGLILGWFWLDRWRFEKKKQHMTQSIQSKFGVYMESLEDLDGVMYTLYTSIPDLDDTQSEESYAPS